MLKAIHQMLCCSSTTSSKTRRYSCSLSISTTKKQQNRFCYSSTRIKPSSFPSRAFRVSASLPDSNFSSFLSSSSSSSSPTPSASASATQSADIHVFHSAKLSHQIQWQQPSLKCPRRVSPRMRWSKCYKESRDERVSMSDTLVYPKTKCPCNTNSKHNQGHVLKIKFCQWCGGQTKHEIPGGEEKMRAICTHCGKIAYKNPKMVVGCLIEHEGKVLLCKRNIQPSYGLWTLPAGYMEIGESGAEGAIRETWEEARAEVEVLSPFAQLDIPLIGQTYIIFLAKLKKPHFAPGPESLECQLFMLDDIPFDSLAFSSIYVTLSLYREDVKNGTLKFHYGTINKRPGSGPSDARAYTLDYHLQS